MISIITCIRDQRKDLLELCARSVAEQPGKWEWIVVDDGSQPDFSRSYPSALAGMQWGSQVRWITLDRNVGLARARNVGLALAEGDWIIVLDSDDELAPGVVGSVHAISRRGKMAAFATEYLTVKGVEVRRIGLWAELFASYGLGPLDPFLWFDFYYHGIFARRDLLLEIGGYLPDLAVGEDQDILLRACERSGKAGIVFIEELGYRYRENPGGVCATRWEEVERNYTATMTEAARRRGADFQSCRRSGTREWEGSIIDEYSYLSKQGWLRWEDALADLRT